MGKAYHLCCTDCGWNEVFYLGSGRNDGPQQASEALDELLRSEYGETYRACLDAQDHSGIRIERVLYRCRHCGELQVRLQAQLRSEDLVISPAYYCIRCGKMLGKVRPHLIKKQPCPRCRGAISVSSVAEWEIAPSADPGIHK